MDVERILDGLNAEQRRAVEAVRGPVCILAGAGSGKTTTITRRIAYQVATGACRPEQILAVTFTDKAAGEMRERLRVLGVRGVTARTFHSAAYGQLRELAPAAPEKVLASKVLLLRWIANGLPRPYRFRPAVDLATEIEWAKARRLTPRTYLGALGERKPPIPPDLMVRVFAEYERRKDADGAVDFEDLLELAIRLFEEDEHALASVRERFAAFTVDEYQDVNLLQQTLLDLWLGAGDDLCAVGDDYQSIYAFTGATPEHLLALPARFPHATVVRLEANYRSTSQVLEFANRLVPHLGGAAKVLRATLGDGPEPAAEPVENEPARVVERVRALHAEGVPLEEMAVLVRTNARTVEFEEAFHRAEIPHQGASLLDRDAARQLLKRLKGAQGEVGPLVRFLAVEHGWIEKPPDRLGERELVRQSDLTRLVQLAARFDGTPGEWIAWLKQHYGPSSGSGVHLLTLHRAKGLEWDAVFLPHVEERELPFKLAKTDEEIAEERRLLYVGLTRARRWLYVTWSQRPSRFLREMGVAAQAPPPVDAADLPPAFAALREWRINRARADGVPAYVVFHDRTLAEIATRAPRTRAELAAIGGIGPAKLDRYAEEVLAVVGST
jgi:DNA helicase-2/ATP-dependent DNA helicase PcrA